MQKKIFDECPQKAKPFLKWAGGKRQLIKQLTELAPKKFNNYFEPFLGGGALFFELSKQSKIKKCYLNDSNTTLINAYKTSTNKQNSIK